MKLILLFALFIVSLNSYSQEKSYIPVSFDGIGKIKIGMKINELEKAIGTKVVLNRTPDMYQNMDTVKLYSDGIYLQVIFRDDFLEDKKGPVIYMVSGDSPKLKTNSGIGLNDDKCKIINAYPDYHLDCYIDNYENGQIVSDKTIVLVENDRKLIAFSLVKNMVTRIEVSQKIEQ